MEQELFHNRLKNLRKFRGIKQSDITGKIKIPPTTYSYYENGKTQPSISSIAKLADFFNVTTDYLIGRTDSPDGLVITILPETFKEIGINYITVSAERLYNEGLLKDIYVESTTPIIEELFHDRLKKLRISKELKQIDVVKSGLIASSTYSDYETGKRRPTLSFLIKLANYFNVTADFLVGRVNEPDGLIITVLPQKLKDSGVRYITVPASRLFKDGVLENIYEEILKTFKNIQE